MAGAVLGLMVGGLSVAEVVTPMAADASEPCTANSAACAIVNKAVDTVCYQTQADTCSGQVCVVLYKANGGTEDFCVDYAR